MITGHYTEDVSITVTNNSLNGATCSQFMWLEESEDAIDIASHNVTVGWDVFAGGETKVYQATIDADTPSDGVLRRWFHLRSDGQGPCQADGKVYIIPGWERSIAKSWHPTEPTMFMYRGQLLPTSTSWETLHIFEYFVDSEGSDTCHDADGFFEMPYTSPNANPDSPLDASYNYRYWDEWEVQSNNKWGPLTSLHATPTNRDVIGCSVFNQFDSATQTNTVRNPVVGWYRADPDLYTNAQREAVALGEALPNAVPEPCTITWQQHMVLRASDIPAIGTTDAGYVEYDVNEIIIEITDSTIEISRDGESSGVLTWP